MPTPLSCIQTYEWNLTQSCVAVNGFLDFVNELVWQKRFWKTLDVAHIIAQRFAVGGDKQYRDSGVDPADMFDQRWTIHVGHQDICKDQTDRVPVRLKQGQRLIAIAGVEDRKTALFEQQANEPANHRFIVDNEDAGGGYCGHERPSSCYLTPSLGAIHYICNLRFSA